MMSVPEILNSSRRICAPSMIQPGTMARSGNQYVSSIWPVASLRRYLKSVPRCWQNRCNADQRSVYSMSYRSTQKSSGPTRRTVTGSWMSPSLYARSRMAWIICEAYMFSNVQGPAMYARWSRAAMSRQNRRTYVPSGPASVSISSSNSPKNTGHHSSGSEPSSLSAASTAMRRPIQSRGTYWPLTLFSGLSLRRGARAGYSRPLSRRSSSVATGWSLDSRMTPDATRDVMSTHSPARYTRTRTRKRRGEMTTYGPSQVSHGQSCQVWTLCSVMMSCHVGRRVAIGYSSVTSPVGGVGHVTSHGAPGCCGTSRRVWRYACHCSRVVPAGSGASGSMSQSVSAKRRFRSARREAHAWASRSASISACVRQRISAIDDHLQVVGPETSPRVQRGLVLFRRLVFAWLRSRRDGPQERHVQLPVHAAGCEHRAGVECADDFCDLAIWQVCEIENISRTVD